MKAVIGLAGLVLLALSISRIKSYYDLKSLIKEIPLGEIIMTEITQAQIEKWKQDSETLDLIEKILVLCANSGIGIPENTIDHLVNIIKMGRNNNG